MSDNLIWHTESHLPADEPCADNLADYRHPQLMRGASADARFIFDAVYAPERAGFVLTLMQINDEWGFIEHELRLHPHSRAELLQQIERFCRAPAAYFADAP